ncbi:amidohydrolase family protein [Xylanibacter ruminicola]|uniref:amidohydrolase family protein n=1 Tax=Xylanibacter ruminicola TaxID=839 RepID=UPI00048E0896|nr:amidohydrolase family protein [Xylanibacter ruminicola]
MEKLIIDAHSHLWLNQDTVVNNQRICQLEPNRSRSLFFGEERQMLPPFMTDGQNTAERFLSNMDYAQVAAAVVTQEFIDGIQNSYLLQVESRYPNRFFTFGMLDYRNPDFMQNAPDVVEAFKGIKIPAARLPQQFLTDAMLQLLQLMEKQDKILGIELQDGDAQVGQMEELIQECPNLKIAIGHFGMVTREGWMSQISLARHKNVYVESGGITWLFNDEFYPFPSAIRAIKQAADEVGMDKLMWGSDYPRTITAITYKMSYDFVEKSADLTADEKRMFLGQNAKQFFGFGELPELPYIKNMSE